MRSALQIFLDLSIDGSDAGVGRIANGGFESAVRPSAAGPFEWQIAPGLQPQIVLTTGEKHSGNNSLLILFNSNEAKDFRSVSQLIAVQPDTNYDLELFYRADVKIAAPLRWEVVDSDGQRLDVSDPISNQSQWTAIRFGFRSPAGKDGITVRLVRDSCAAVCPAVGNVWFDDITLRSAGGG